MNKTIGFIGGGNMGSAMIGGIIGSGLSTASQVMVSDCFQASLDRLSATYGIQVTSDNQELVQKSDIVFLSVKPHMYETVIEEIRDFVDEEKLIVAIAAGMSHSKLDNYFGKPAKIVRVMPNTPAMVLEAMSALAPNEHVTDADLQDVIAIFESFGKAEVVPESLMDTVTGISGSSPAYVYMFIEAMADAAVADGMPRTQAYKFAAQSVLGSAKMVLETGKHPGELKDAVCSPGGTTIAAVAKLEEKGLRDAVISAQRCCVQKSKDMSK